MRARAGGDRPGPVTLVVGEEEFLIDRTVRELLAAAGNEDVHDLDGAALAAGELAALTSPSLFGDGSVHFLSPEIRPTVYDALITTNGGEVVEKNDFE